jgi:hypothetical protein
MTDKPEEQTKDVIKDPGTKPGYGLEPEPYDIIPDPGKPGYSVPPESYDIIPDPGKPGYGVPPESAE